MRPGQIALAGLVVAVAAVAGVGARSNLYAPEQPIAYSHKLHAGDLGIQCQYCHTYARRGPIAGVPTVKRCMGCHELVATDRPEVEKLAGYLEREEPIEWLKVYELRDHTRFAHDRHVKAGVECATCHGQVETMERMTRVREMTMGFCVDCHRERGAALDCVACHH